jgi:hypothetical protein
MPKRTHVVEEWYNEKFSIVQLEEILKKLVQLLREKGCEVNDSSGTNFDLDSILVFHPTIEGRTLSIASVYEGRFDERFFQEGYEPTAEDTEQYRNGNFFRLELDADGDMAWDPSYERYIKGTETLITAEYLFGQIVKEFLDYDPEKDED